MAFLRAGLEKESVQVERYLYRVHYVCKCVGAVLVKSQEFPIEKGNANVEEPWISSQPL